MSSYKNFISSIPGAVNGYKSAAEFAGSGDRASGGASNSALPKGREDWTHRDWEKKDPKGLAKMAMENPELKSELYSNCYSL